MTAREFEDALLELVRRRALALLAERLGDPVDPQVVQRSAGPMKLCVGCEIEKRSACFAKNSASKDGLQRYCLVCMRRAKTCWRKKP